MTPGMAATDEETEAPTVKIESRSNQSLGVYGAGISDLMA